MTDMATIAAAVSSLKAAGDMAKALVGIRDGAILNQKVIELQGVILAAQSDALAAQSDQFALLERVRELEADVARLKTWNAEKERYVLTEIGTGAFAYLIKPARRGAEPVHCICVQCYEAGRKATLQLKSNTYGCVILECPGCKNEVVASEDHSNYPFKRNYAPDPQEKARSALETCPICRVGKLETIDVQPHDIFGAAVQVHTLKCDNSSCGRTQQRELNSSYP
jgi:hypothetical protein